MRKTGKKREKRHFGQGASKWRWPHPPQRGKERKKWKRVEVGKIENRLRRVSNPEANTDGNLAARETKLLKYYQKEFFEKNNGCLVLPGETVQY